MGVGASLTLRLLGDKYHIFYTVETQLSFGNSRMGRGGGGAVPLPNSLSSRGMDHF